MHDHHKPFPPPPPPPYGPIPPAPLPPDYPHFIPGGCCHPPVPAMPPVPTVVEGESLYEAVNNCIDRVNVCMDTYNSVMAECYKTLHNLQRAAEENGAYYGPEDVWTEEGYDADSSAKYYIIHKRHVDRRGQPIFMELGLAYDNATNSKIEQSIFSASKVKYADKILVAQPKTEKGWYGKAIWHGAPIQADPAANLWTVGFTKGGYMRVYSNGTSVDTMLADTVFNAMGCSGVLIQDGALTSEMYYNQIPNYDKQSSRVVMGQNIATGEVLILVTGHENNVNAKGMTSTAAAEILRQHGATIAVELCEGESAGACDKGQLMFTPENDTVPTAYCFWYISRRRFYKNDYERELAELTQNYGQAIWQGYLNGEAIQNTAKDLADEIDRAQNAENKLDAAIKAETARAQAAESQLDTKIEAETERAMAAEKALDDKITAETERATAEEARLDAKIDAETARATAAEQDLQQQITAEVNRAQEAEKTLDEKITAETNRAQARENELDEKIQDETNRATLEEGKLNTKIDTEAQRAKDAEAVLQTNIDKEQQARQDADTALGARIDSLSSDVTQQINDFKTEVNTKIDALESNINDLSSTVTGLGEQVTQLGNNVTTLTGTVNQIQQTVNTLQENYTSLSGAVSDLNNQIDKMQSGELDLPYLKRGGDTASGTFDFTDAVVNVAEPTADSNAATKKYVDAGDKTNADAIAAETERATAKDNELEAKITQETTDRTNADSTLQTNIDAEKTRAEAAEKTLDSKITAETTARTEADEAINQSIEEIKQSVEGVKGDYLPLAGGTMTGNIDMRTHTLYNLATPKNPQDAATKKYADDADAVLNAAIQAETKNRETAIEGLEQQIGELEAGMDADMKGYLPLAGGKMNGNLDMGGNSLFGLAAPTSDASAATKKYVDDTVGSVGTRVDALETSQATQDTEIANLKNGSTALPYIKDTGDTVTGTYDFTGADLTVKTPTADASPATKAYVDTKITGLENGSTALPYVKKAGDAMTGALSMGGNKVTSVADPTEDGDAVNYKTMNTMKADLEGQIDNLSDLLDAANQTIQDLEQRVEELEKNPPTPVDPVTKFTKVEMGDIVVTPTGGTTQTAADLTAALNALLAQSNTHHYYVTDHDGNNWYFATDTEVSTAPADVNCSYVDAKTPTQVMINGKLSIKGWEEPVDPATKFTELSLGDVVVDESNKGTTETYADLTASLNHLLGVGGSYNLYKFTDHSGVTWYIATNQTVSAVPVDIECYYVNSSYPTRVHVDGTLVVSAYEKPEPEYGGSEPPFGFESRSEASIFPESYDADEEPWGTVLNDNKDYKYKWYIGTTYTMNANFHCFLFANQFTDDYKNDQDCTFIVVRADRMPITPQTMCQYGSLYRIRF